MLNQTALYRGDLGKFT